MRSRLNKALKAEFHRQMAERFPQFRRFDKLHPYPMAKAYGWSVAPRFALYISVWAAERDVDWFSLECCWSTKDDFPSLEGTRPGWEPETDLRPETLRDRKVTHRISHLMGLYKDYQWWLGPEPDYDDPQYWDDLTAGEDVDYPLDKALAEIPAAVRDALDQVDKYAMPYFRAVAAAVGVDLSALP
jgi:hypothetical protein